MRTCQNPRLLTRPMSLSRLTNVATAYSLARRGPTGDTSMTDKIYYERIEDAIERNRPGIPALRKRLEAAGVKYVLSSWIDRQRTICGHSAR